LNYFLPKNFAKRKAPNNKGLALGKCVKRNMESCFS